MVVFLQCFSPFPAPPEALGAVLLSWATALAVSQLLSLLLHFPCHCISYTVARVSFRMYIGNLLPVISWHIGSTCDSRMQRDTEVPLLKKSLRTFHKLQGQPWVYFWHISPILLCVTFAFVDQVLATLACLQFPECISLFLVSGFSNIVFPLSLCSLQCFLPLSFYKFISSQFSDKYYFLGKPFLSMLFTPPSQLSHILMVTFSSQCLITVSKYMFGYMFFNVCLPLAYKLCEFTDLDGFAQLNKYLGNEQ